MASAGRDSASEMRSPRRRSCRRRAGAASASTSQTRPSASAAQTFSDHARHRSVPTPHIARPTSHRRSLACQTSTMQTAFGNCSATVFQIHFAPPPFDPAFDARFGRRRLAGPVMLALVAGGSRPVGLWQVRGGGVILTLSLADSRLIAEPPGARHGQGQCPGRAECKRGLASPTPRTTSI